MRTKVRDILLFTISFVNITIVEAQIVTNIEGTVWEYLWDESMHRDFIAFNSCNTSISYSYELDEFEFSKYHTYEDTIVITTYYNPNVVQSETPLESVTYYYKIDKNCLYLLFSVYRYCDGHIKRNCLYGSYKLFKISD